mgnify:CR=1 FL=1
MTNQNHELVVFWQNQKKKFLLIHFHSKYGSKLNLLTGRTVTLINDIIDIYYKMTNSTGNNIMELYTYRLKIIQNEIRDMNNQFAELQNELVVD